VDGSAGTPSTIAEVLELARIGYAELLEIAEGIEDEWSETNDLAAAWRARIDEVELARGAEAVSARVVAAARALVAEAALIDDPHRAIDWLSTYPQVLLVALDEQP
jgi:hypothetical protein